jgi:hypothetical protein
VAASFTRVWDLGILFSFLIRSGSFLSNLNLFLSSSCGKTLDLSVQRRHSGLEP